MNTSDDEYLSQKDIDSITSMPAGMEILEKRKMLYNYVNDLDDIKQILIMKYHPKQECVENITNRNLYKEYPNLIEKFKEFLKQLENFLQLDEFKKEIGEIYEISKPQTENIIKSLKTMLSCEKFPILIAGEAKAGKSTFINLLLGKDLLPTSLLTCTRIICEIYNSDEEKVEFTGSKNKTLEMKAENLKEISDIIKQETRDYDKASFKCSVDFLENYTCLVDSPGLGDTNLLNNVAFDYICKFTPAFIFVLNATNSGGLNINAKTLIKEAKNQLIENNKNLLKDFQSSDQVNEFFYQYEKAIFILNHWDIIRQNANSKEIQEFQNQIVEDIKECWHESVEINKQIFFISAKQKNEWQKQGLVHIQIVEIKNCIRKLIVNLYRKNLESSIKLLDKLFEILEKIILEKVNDVVDNKYCKLFEMSNAEEKCKAMENLLNEIEIKKDKMRRELQPKFEIMSNFLTNYLKSEPVQIRIIESSLEKLDINIDNINILKTIYKQSLEKKLFEEIIAWENENKQMEELYEFLSGLIKDNLNEICDKIKSNNTFFNEKALLKEWKNLNENDSSLVNIEFISKIEKVFIISTITLLFPVVALAGVLATPLIVRHIMQENKKNDLNLSKYKQNRKLFLKELTSSILDNLTSINVRRNFFKNVEKKCQENINLFDSFVVTEIKMQKQRVLQLKNETRNIPEILICVNDLFYRIEKSYGQFSQTINCSVTMKDFSLIVPQSTHEKFFDSENSFIECLYSGKYSQVYKKKTFPIEIYKTFTQKFKDENARFQMQEIDLLRKVNVDFILRCKSVILDKEENLIVILENVDCNLHTYLCESEDLIPWNKVKNSDLWKTACVFIFDVSIQICEGINYIYQHDIRMVHPDLKIYSILVRKSSSLNKVQIFICDACCNLATCRESENSDIILHETFDMGGYIKENIFRLGVIFYQAAYFKSENRKIKIDNEHYPLNPIECNPDINWNIVNENILPNNFIKLIENCTSLKPEIRPDVKDVINILGEEIKFINS